MLASRPLEILYVRSLYRPADFGGNRYPWEVTQRLARRGHRVRVITPRPAGPLPGEPLAQIKTYPASRRTPFETFVTNALMSRLTVERALRERPADIVVLSSYEVAYGYFRFARRRRPASAFIYHSRFRSDAVERLRTASGLNGSAGALLSRFVAHVESTTFRYADLLIAVSPYSKVEIEQRVGGSTERIRVIPTGVDTDVFAPGSRRIARQALGITDDDVVFIAVGRLVPVKRYDRALRTVDLLRRAGRRVVLLLVGTGPEAERLQALTQELGLEDQVRFEGFRENDELRLRYQAADAQLCTSEFENWSLSLLEGFASGIPAFGVPRGSIPDLLRLVDASLISDTVEPEQIAETIAIHLGQAGRLGALGKRARAIAVSRFDWERVVGDLEASFRSVIRP